MNKQLTEYYKAIAALGVIIEKTAIKVKKITHHHGSMIWSTILERSSLKKII